MKLKNDIDPNVILPQVEKMLYKLSWKTAAAYDIPFDAVLSEAYHAFMAACRNFEPDRGSSITTWIYFKTWTHLKTWITKRANERLVFMEEVTDELAGPAPAQESPAIELIHTMSMNAREIIELLLETPEDVLGGKPLPPRQLLNRVKDYLVTRGMKRTHVEKAHKEITATLREAWAAN